MLTGDPTKAFRPMNARRRPAARSVGNGARAIVVVLMHPWRSRRAVRLLTRLVATVALEQPEQLANLTSGLGAVPHLRVAVDDVAASSSGSLALHVRSFHEIGDDALHGAFSDPHRLRNVPESHTRISCDAEQDLSVIRDEAPRPLRSVIA